VDHHLHTARHSPDSLMEPREMIEAALSRGLDAVVITEHDYQWKPRELAELQREAGDRLLVLSGAEVSAREGHFLVYGLPNLDAAPPGIALSRLVEVVRGHRGAIVGAHPFRWGQDFRTILDNLGPDRLDGLERVSKNVTTETRQAAETLLREHPHLVGTGSSDSHEPETLGCYHSEADRPIRSMADFIAAIKARALRARHHQASILASGPVVDEILVPAS
jgi:predicted metal-dependent phosphoesterase TrpH